MAQKTALSISGVPGMVHAFSAKTAVSLEYLVYARMRVVDLLGRSNAHTDLIGTRVDEEDLLGRSTRIGPLPRYP